MKIEIIDKRYERKLNWDDGKLYCELLTIHGKTDWRLPTIEELVDISYSATDFNSSCYFARKPDLRIAIRSIRCSTLATEFFLSARYYSCCIASNKSSSSGNPFKLGLYSPMTI